MQQTRRTSLAEEDPHPCTVAANVRCFSRRSQVTKCCHSHYQQRQRLVRERGGEENERRTDIITNHEIILHQQAPVTDKSRIETSSRHDMAAKRRADLALKREEAIKAKEEELRKARTALDEDRVSIFVIIISASRFPLVCLLPTLPPRSPPHNFSKKTMRE